MRPHDLLVAQRAELRSLVSHWWHSKSRTALSAPPLLHAFAEEESEAASCAPWRRQLWLALASFGLLVLGSAANSWLGALAAVLRRRQLARVAARGWVEQPDDEATAVRPWVRSSSSAVSVEALRLDTLVLTRFVSLSAVQPGRRAMGRLWRQQLGRRG